MIDWRRVAALQAVAEHGTVTAAARTLHLTPSAVSQQVRQLADEVGAPLLRHEGRGVRLTPEAHVVLQHGEQLRVHWELAKADLAALREDVTGTLRVCGVSSAIAALVAPALASLRAAHPRLHTRVQEEESADCYRLLLGDESDLAVVLPTPGAPAAADPRYEHHPVVEDRLDLLVPAGHRLATSDGTELAEAAGEAWVVKRHDNDSYALLSVACTSAGFTPDVAHEVKEWYAVSAMVAAGFGVCLLPRLVPVPVEHAVVRVPLHGRPVPSRRIVACVRRGSAGHRSVAAGLEALRVAASRATHHQR